jgi:hypothetical protein
MNRGPKGSVVAQLKRKKAGLLDVAQYSTIIGSVAANERMRRPYASMSSVHKVPTAKTYIKAMLMMARESSKLIKDLMPVMYASQRQLIKENVPPEFQFSDMFTSSIANFNIAVSYHQDKANIKGCSNIIITKRKNCEGGNLHVPDYGITIDSCDNSILYYPAWLNMHGVTPIKPTVNGGYRNTLIFYPLKAFKKYIKEEQPT